MSSANSAIYTQRPNPRTQRFAPTPEYKPVESHEDKLAILVCQIKIWRAENNKWYPAPQASDSNCLTLRECESIEITDSAKDLLGKAVVKFPRGTIIQKCHKNKEVRTGNSEDRTQSTATLMEASNQGEVITQSMAQYSEDGISTASLAANYADNGLIDFNRTKTEMALLSPNDVAVGNRIEIRLGYAYSEVEYNQMNSTDNHPDMVVAFTGFITSISVNTPLEINCTNMAYVLACAGIEENIQSDKTLSVKEFLDAGSKYHVLDDTGIELAEESKALDITVSGGSITKNLTVADVLTNWNKGGVLTMMKTNPSTGVAKLHVGLTYFAGKLTGNESQRYNSMRSDKKYITYNGGINTIPIIQFDWDVAQDKLKVQHVDKSFIAVEAQGRAGANKYFKLTIRKNPDRDNDGWISEDEGEFQTVNVKVSKAKKGEKFREGTMSDRKHPNITDRVKLNKYVVIPYISVTPNIDREKLIEEAKQYWANYIPNGISGSIEIFGDVFVQPTDIIGIIDPRQPERNGYYYVESVNSSFGVNGYRRELKIPYKILSFTNPVKIIR